MVALNCAVHSLFPGNGTGERSELNSEAQVGHNHGNSDQENTGRKEVLQEEAVKVRIQRLCLCSKLYSLPVRENV